MSHSRRANVAFAGLTAAGKTTHARLLAGHLGYEYVSAVETMLHIIGMDASAEGVWFERSSEIRAARAGDAADVELDRYLQHLAATRHGTVFDTWALAWLSPSPMVRIWIESDLESRARKCLVSQERTRLPLRDCRELVRAKDRETREGFVRRHGFDLFTDRARYDVIVCNSHLIPAADRDCADRGIAAFAPVVYDTATALLRGGPDPEICRIAERYPSEVLRIGGALGCERSSQSLRSPAPDHSSPDVGRIHRR